MNKNKKAFFLVSRKMKGNKCFSFVAVRKNLEKDEWEKYELGYNNVLKLLGEGEAVFTAFKEHGVWQVGEKVEAELRGEGHGGKGLMRLSRTSV